MSEEEKKAIEKFKKKIERADKDILKFSDVYTTLDIHNLRLLLNLIERQQKEIKDLKEDLSKKVEALDIAMSNPDYISKDKIRETIERLRKQHKNIFDAQMLYKELLGEKINY